LENLEYMFLFPISKEPKSFTLQQVVPIKEVGPRSKVEKSRRLKEELVSYVNLMACHDFCIFSRGKDKGNNYWALPNHARGFAR